MSWWMLAIPPYLVGWFLMAVYFVRSDYKQPRCHAQQNERYHDKTLCQVYHPRDCWRRGLKSEAVSDDSELHASFISLFWPLMLVLGGAYGMTQVVKKTAESDLTLIPKKKPKPQADPELVAKLEKDLGIGQEIVKYNRKENW